MRAKELKKGDQTYNRGRIMMTVDGLEAEVRSVEAVLNKEFSSTQYEEEGDNEGEISISYMIDRDEKAYFMDVYKKAKATIKKA